jgi:uncharacterized YccA/Bax inhibitor family protein
MNTRNPMLSRDTAFEGSRDNTMTINGVVHKTGILILICMAATAYNWSTEICQGPAALLAALAAFILALVATFKPATAPFLAPGYAVLEGLVLGWISLLFNTRYPGLPANAMLITFAVLGTMLFLYTTRLIRVTNSLRTGIVIATAAIAITYLVDMVLGFFGHSVPFINSTGPIGIIVSLVICGIAAFNFLLDFDTIEKYTNRGAPKYMEWYCGLALLITLVWVYLEILRLLAKMRRR